MALMPGQFAPILNVPTLGRDYWTLGRFKPKSGTLIFFYRGFGCSQSQQIVSELEARIKEFLEVGADAIAISSDTKADASSFAERANIKTLRLGYGLATEMAIEWGLYLSEPPSPYDQRIC